MDSTCHETAGGRDSSNQPLPPIPLHHYEVVGCCKQKLVLAGVIAFIFFGKYIVVTSLSLVWYTCRKSKCGLTYLGNVGSCTCSFCMLHVAQSHVDFQVIFFRIFSTFSTDSRYAMCFQHLSKFENFKHISQTISRGNIHTPGHIRLVCLANTNLGDTITNGPPHADSHSNGKCVTYVCFKK